MAEPKLSICPLCRASSDLRVSHIIPRFVVDWFKETSATGFMRAGETPNLRSQDGPKLRMLCGQCEQRLSVWEKLFAESCFVPLVTGGAVGVTYHNWMLKFLTSVSWRVVTYFAAHELLKSYPESVVDRATKAQETWRRFLMDEAPHPGQHEQHLMFVGPLTSLPAPNLPPNMNRYIARSLEIYVAYNEVGALTYAKMGPFLLFGYIDQPTQERWQNTKTHVRRGRIEVDNFRVPGVILKFVADRALRAIWHGQALSERQVEKIRDAYRRNRERATASETFRAIDLDVRLFGRESVFNPDIEK